MINIITYIKKSLFKFVVNVISVYLLLVTFITT